MCGCRKLNITIVICNAIIKSCIYNPYIGLKCNPMILYATASKEIPFSATILRLLQQIIQERLIYIVKRGLFFKNQTIYLQQSFLQKASNSLILTYRLMFFLEFTHHTVSSSGRHLSTRHSPSGPFKSFYFRSLLMFLCDISLHQQYSAFVCWG